MRFLIGDVQFSTPIDDGVATRIATDACERVIRRIEALEPGGLQGHLAALNVALPFPLSRVIQGYVTEQSAAQVLAERMFAQLFSYLSPVAQQRAVVPARIVRSNEAAPEGFVRSEAGDVVAHDVIVPSAGSGPPVHIDYNHPEIMQFVAYSRMVAHRAVSPLQRVQAIQNYIQQRMRPDGAAWEALENGEKQRGASVISLGDYFRAGVGVCKQNALALQIGLQELGMGSKYVRGFVQKPDGGRGSHAWVEAEIDGTSYVVDNLWNDWNLQRAEDVYHPNWNGPRGFRPIKDPSHAAVFFVPTFARQVAPVSAMEPYPIGSNVLVPRSSGAAVPGRVTAYMGDNVRVDFVENGQAAYKIVPRAALDYVNPLVTAPVPERLPPELQARAVASPYVVGQRVLVPRSSGVPSPGIVQAVLQGGASYDVDVGGGAHKIVTREALDAVNPRR